MWILLRMLHQPWHFRISSIAGSGQMPGSGNSCWRRISVFTGPIMQRLVFPFVAAGQADTGIPQNCPVSQIVHTPIQDIRIGSPKHPKEPHKLLISRLTIL